jgi:anti-anti-sigma factor
MDVTGRLDAVTSPAFEKEIIAFFSNPAQGLALDFGQLDYISSAGVGAIIKAKMSLMRNYGDLAILNPQPQVRKVFDIMKLLPAMNVFANIKELDEYLTRIQRRVLEGEAIYE